MQKVVLDHKVGLVTSCAGTGKGAESHWQEGGSDWDSAFSVGLDSLVKRTHHH